jgi:hypothetical protein
MKYISLVVLPLLFPYYMVLINHVVIDQSNSITLEYQVEEGNPHVIWSASEDGTLRQYDLREDITCPQNGTGSADHECRNVLVSE